MDTDDILTLGRDDSDGFEIALRRRPGAGPDGQDVDELIVNGMFAMDSVDVSSELALASLVPVDAEQVLVGGLGLGYTAGAVLDRCPEATVQVVELSSALIGWARKGFTAGLAHVAGNPRAEIIHADIKQVLGSRGPSPSPLPIELRSPARDEGAPDGARSERGGSRGSSPSLIKYDAILLDVDNGPSFLIHEHNEPLYDLDLLRAAYRRLAPGGLLAIWCEQESPELDAQLRRLDPHARLVSVPVERDGHQFDYAIHVARRAAC